MPIYSLDALISASQPAKPRAVGIDLGTTHSLVALDCEGEIQILRDHEGEVLLPSVVRYLSDETSPVVGIAAKSTLMSDPQNTIPSVKRHMGTSQQFDTAQGARTPVQVSADILKALMQRVHERDPSIHDAVITVPAYFDESQRQATKLAAQMAGIRVLRLLNEPTAAAVAYGLDHSATGRCLVFDLGGGTFDVSLLNITKGVIEVLATGGDTALGGDDLDVLLVKWIQSQLASDEISERELLVKARIAKESLSTETSVLISLSNGITFTLTRAVFEGLIEPLLARMIKICQRVLVDAQCDKSTLAAVILVGGATKIPYLQKTIADFFEQIPRCDKDPSTVVALGAGLQASVLSGYRQDSALLLDVIPLSLGLEMMGGVVEKILPRNTPIPACVTESFTTYADNQTGLLLHIVQGERELANECRSLGRFELTGIPPMPAGKAKIQVTYQIDLDGLLVVTAKETSTQQQNTMQVKPTYGLQERDVVQAIESAIAHAAEDMKEKQLQKKREEAEIARRMNALLKQAVSLEQTPS